MRIYTVEGHVRDNNGSRQVFRRGNYYNLKDHVAQELIDVRVAYDENNPPECRFCEESFEGLDAYGLVKVHENDEHLAERIQEMTKEQLRSLAVANDISPADIPGSGVDGAVLVEDYRDVLTAVLVEGEPAPEPEQDEE